MQRAPGVPFLHWPGRDALGHAVVLAVLLCLWFALVYGGADLITGRRSLRFRVHTAWELEWLPYVPALFLVYVSACPVFSLAPFDLRGRRELDAYALAFAGVTGTAGLCFLAFPAELAYPAARESGPWAGLADAARAVALRYNLAPSLHVALTVLAVACYSKHARPAGRALLWLYAALLAAATLLTWQHHLLDVVTGWPLGLAGKRLVFDRICPREDAAQARP